MVRVYLALVDIVPAAVVLVPLHLVFYFSIYRRKLRRSVLSCLFCLYLSAVFALVGIPNVTYIRPELNLNLIPFRGILEDGKNSILNVALFIPLGMFLPVLWSRFRRTGAAALYGLGFSLGIELLQMLTFRATDMNDLITNVLGTLVGFLLTKPIAAKLCPPLFVALDLGQNSIKSNTAICTQSDGGVSLCNQLSQGNTIPACFLASVMTWDTAMLFSRVL